MKKEDKKGLNPSPTIESLLEDIKKKASNAKYCRSKEEARMNIDWIINTINDHIK